jgi:hypothetical protein
MSDLEPTCSQFLVYQDATGTIRIKVRFDGGTAWLTQAHVVELVDSPKDNINRHLTNVIAEDKLEPTRTVRRFRTVRRQGSHKDSLTVRRDGRRNTRTSRVYCTITSTGYRGACGGKRGEPPMSARHASLRMTVGRIMAGDGLSRGGHRWRAQICCST